MCVFYTREIGDKPFKPNEDNFCSLVGTSLVTRMWLGLVIFRGQTF